MYSFILLDLLFLRLKILTKLNSPQWTSTFPTSFPNLRQIFILCISTHPVSSVVEIIFHWLLLHSYLQTESIQFNGWLYSCLLLFPRLWCVIRYYIFVSMFRITHGCRYPPLRRHSSLETALWNVLNVRLINRFPQIINVVPPIYNNNKSYCIDGVVIAAQWTATIFQIYCAPPNLGIRTWICQLNFAQRPMFSGLRFFNEPEISDSGPPA